MNLSGLLSFTFASGKKFFLFLSSSFFKKGFSFFSRFKSDFSDLELEEKKEDPDELFEFS
jgi:hypothetical protein